MALLEAGTTLSRYTLLGKLATGGMAEVYLARQSGASGFSKIVVVKVILPHLASEQSFMRMFRNEARLAALLNHPGIVQVFDFGEENDLNYMVMEYIDGRNLNRIGRMLHERGQPIPRPVAVRIIADTCAALDYAHRLQDSDGNQLKIIHRDISRENVLVTYAGQVKVVDFGIAKATILESSTEGGTLKGKYSYMAPEMLLGKELDRRIDIYATGVLLYTLTTGRPPFRAESPGHLLQMILNEEPPPPRMIEPGIPDPLEQITLRAMHKDRDQRYQWAAELQADLERYLIEHETAVMPYHLAEFMTATFPPGTDNDRDAYHSLTGTTPARAGKVPIVLQDGSGDSEASTRSSPGAPTRPSPRRQLGSVLVGLGLLAVGGAVTTYLLVRPGRPAPAAVARPDGRPAPDTSRVVAEAPADMSTPDLPPPTKAPTPAGTPPVQPKRLVGHVSIEAPGPGEVHLGKRRLGAVPLVNTSLPVGRHVLTVSSRKLGYSMDRKVHVQAGARQNLKLTPRKGTIQILVFPWAKVTLDGRLLGITPLDPVEVYEGPHHLRFENDKLGVTRQRTVRVQPGQVSKVKLMLQQ